MKYIIQAQIEFEVDAEDAVAAREEGTTKLKEIDDAYSQVQISNAKVVHKPTGFFV